MGNSIVKRSLLAASVISTLVAVSGSPGALTNGNFASPGTSGQLTVNTTLAGWTGIGREGTFGSQTTPPVFVFSTGSTAELSSTGVNGDAFMGNVKFYGATAAPGGGVVVAADGDPAWGGGISQTISGLTVGSTYNLGFEWAGAQQQGFSGNTTEDWQVTFGSATQSTATVATPSQTFVGWQSGSMNFTATSPSQVLQFMAVGSPSGEPPWLLLNNVSLTSVSVPEPVSLGLVALSVPLLLRRRRVTE